MLLENVGALNLKNAIFAPNTLIFSAMLFHLLALMVEHARYVAHTDLNTQRPWRECGQFGTGRCL